MSQVISQNLRILTPPTLAHHIPNRTILDNLTVFLPRAISGFLLQGEQVCCKYLTSPLPRYPKVIFFRKSNFHSDQIGESHCFGFFITPLIFPRLSDEVRNSKRYVGIALPWNIATFSMGFPWNVFFGLLD